MAGYIEPKKKLHREFVYLNYDAILNSLSAFEAGQVDEIVEKTVEAAEGGIDGGIGFKGAKIAGNRKKQATLQEELVRTRTWFSAFESWHSKLVEEEALGGFSTWDMSVRDQIEIGDTIEFRAAIRISPLFKLVTAFLSYASNAGALQLKGSELTTAKQNANMMRTWISNKDGARLVGAYFDPMGVTRPRIVGRLSDKYLVSGLDNIEEEYQVVAQVRTILSPNAHESILRILRDAPPVPKEVETVTEAMKHMQEGSVHLGVPFEDDDLVFSHPDVIVQPIAIYK